jgi:hypothetical protein
VRPRRCGNWNIFLADRAKSIAKRERVLSDDEIGESPRRVIRPDRDTLRQDEPQEHATAPQEAAKAGTVGEPPHFPTRRSLRGLDWFIFFVADVQTGFGPFVAVYLTAQKWTQVDIGLVLTVGALASLAGQMPGGALVDAARSERLVAGIAVAAIAISALAYAASPVFAVILAATVLHSAASCVLGPAMAAISLGLVGHGAIGEDSDATPVLPPSGTGSRPR